MHFPSEKSRTTHNCHLLLLAIKTFLIKWLYYDKFYITADISSHSQRSGIARTNLITAQEEEDLFTKKTKMYTNDKAIMAHSQDTYNLMA